MTPDEARDQAKIILGKVAMGGDPAADRTADRSAVVSRRERITFKAMAEIFLRDHVEAKRKPKTMIDYKALLERHA